MTEDLPELVYQQRRNEAAYPLCRILYFSVYVGFNLYGVVCCIPISIVDVLDCARELERFVRKVFSCGRQKKHEHYALRFFIRV